MTKFSAEEAQINEQAADWFVRLQSPKATCQERTDFGEWLVASPAHEAAYFELERLEDCWAELGARTDLAAVAESYRHAETFSVGKPRSKGRLGWPLAMAASLLVTVGVALMGYLTWEPSGKSFETALGEQRIITLDDGSQVTLNTLTSLSVSYHQEKRRIQLHRGQANFRVKKDTRPFLVEAGQGVVQALGTRFDVYERDGNVTVTLIEGKVEVRPKQSEPFAPLQLHPGEQVAFDGEAVVSPVSRVDLDRVTAWQQRRLDFSDTPLSEVVAEVNRYSAKRLELGDEALSGLRINGVFDAGDSDAVVRALKVYFNVTAYESERLVVIKGSRVPH